jgi:hypothetical protein
MQEKIQKLVNLSSDMESFAPYNLSNYLDLNEWSGANLEDAIARNPFLRYQSAFAWEVCRKGKLTPKIRDLISNERPQRVYSVPLTFVLFAISKFYEPICVRRSSQVDILLDFEAARRAVGALHNWSQKLHVAFPSNVQRVAMATLLCLRLFRIPRHVIFLIINLATWHKEEWDESIEMTFEGFVALTHLFPRSQ